MSTISSDCLLLGSLFNTLTTATYGWTVGSIAAAMQDINGSQFMVDELEDLQSEGWIIIAKPTGQTYTYVGNTGKGTIVISSVFGGRAFSPAPGGIPEHFNDSDFFAASLSYELGHAEDPQLNTIQFAPVQDEQGYTLGGTDLALGANVALDLFSEGKSVVNNFTCASQSYLSGSNNMAILVPYENVQNDIEAGNIPQAIIDGAISTALQNPAAGDLLVGYWNDWITIDLPAIELTAPTKVYDALMQISIGASSTFTLSQNADGTDSMTIIAGSGTIQTYVVDFGNYGALAASDVSGQTPEDQYKTPSPTSVTTYQEFTFTNGDILREEYIFNTSTMISATAASETLIGQGSFAGVGAGGSMDTLIDLSGTSSMLEDGGFASVTEEALNGTKNAENVFSFSGGTNILIGDLGHNTFVENLSATSAINIIYGGGGDSTYELSGVIDILYTKTTPTPEEIENLNLQILSKTIPTGYPEVGGGSAEIINYIIDPNKTDVLELPSYKMVFPPGGGEAISFTGTPTYSSIAGNYGKYAPINGFYQGDQNNDLGADFDRALSKNGGYSHDENIIGQGVNSGDGGINIIDGAVIVNGYLPKGFGDNVLKATSKKADQKFITLPTSSSSVLSMSSAPPMAILKPTEISASSDSPWDPLLDPGFLNGHQSAYQMGATELKPVTAAHVVDLIATASKWIPTITFQT